MHRADELPDAESMKCVRWSHVLNTPLSDCFICSEAQTKEKGAIFLDFNVHKSS